MRRQHAKSLIIDGKGDSPQPYHRRWEGPPPAPEAEPLRFAYEPRLSGRQPDVGDKVRFVPAANYDNSAGFGDVLMVPVTGTIIQIHAEHRWYRVEFTMGTKPGRIGHECFKY